MKRISLTLAVLTTTAVAQGQERAPRETVTAALGGKKVAIEYGRPSLKGRTLDSLLAQLPADRIWRAGVDQVTTLTTEADVAIGGTRVPAGKYSLYMHLPEPGPASLVLNSDPGVPLKVIYAKAPPALADALWPRLDGYEKVKATEVARIPLQKAAPARSAEQFQITLSPTGEGKTSLLLTWGDRGWQTDVAAATP